jgi:predicted PurR-regulated permease PerM
MARPEKIEISHRTIIFIAIFGFALWLITQTWDILLLFFVSVIVMSALKPGVDLLERLKLPRSLSIIIVYIIIWGLLGGLVASLIPPLIEQTRHLVTMLPPTLDNLDYLSTHQQEITSQLLAGIGAIPENVFKVLTNLFGNILNVITVMVISFYLLLEREHLDTHLTHMIDKKYAVIIIKIFTQIESKLGGWIRGELVLMLAVGSLTYLGLKVLGVDTALPLALLAGLLEVIPNIGPTISAIPAILIALTIHPLLALSTTALYFLVQFFENNVLVPQIMKRATGVNPLVSIFALMVGFRLAGVVGAVLSIPSVLVIQSIISHFFSDDSTNELSQASNRIKE